jgi:hypothetical protein
MRDPASRNVCQFTCRDYSFEFFHTNSFIMSVYRSLKRRRKLRHRNKTAPPVIMDLATVHGVEYASLWPGSFFVNIPKWYIYYYEGK